MNPQDPREKAFQYLKNILHKETLQKNLLFTSLFVMTFESLRDMIIDNPRGFYCSNWKIKGGKIQTEHTPDYKASVIALCKKNNFTASLRWFRDRGAIANQDIKLIEDIGHRRDAFAHELFSLVVNGIPESDLDLWAELFRLYKQIDHWWTVNYACLVDPKTGEIIDPSNASDACSMASVMLDMVLDVAFLGNEDHYKDFLAMFEHSTSEKGRSNA